VSIAMKLIEIIPWGRSFDASRLMFGMSERDLAGRVQGCGDGPASFNAEATALGHAVISCDPIYGFSTDEIRQREEDSYETVISQVWTIHSPRLANECIWLAIENKMVNVR